MNDIVPGSLFLCLSGDFVSLVLSEDSSKKFRYTCMNFYPDGRKYLDNWNFDCPELWRKLA